MVAPRDIRTAGEGDGLERLKVTDGYVLPDDQRVEDVLASDAKLLLSEGIDPAWPGFDRVQPESAK